MSTYDKPIEGADAFVENHQDEKSDRHYVEPKNKKMNVSLIA